MDEKPIEEIVCTITCKKCGMVVVLTPDDPVQYCACLSAYSISPLEKKHDRHTD